MATTPLYLFYKIVMTNKASTKFNKFDLSDRIIPDFPPFAIHGWFCVDCQISGKDSDASSDLPTGEFQEIHIPGEEGRVMKREIPRIVDGKKISYTSGDHIFNELPKGFGKFPESDVIQGILYKRMLEIWPNLGSCTPRKFWDYEFTKHCYEIDCDELRYLTIASEYGGWCIDYLMEALRRQTKYVFGSNERYSCKEFQQWVNGVFGCTVDCRFYRLQYDRRFFGLKKVGVLGRLNTRTLEWTLVNLVVSDANVDKDEEETDEKSRFYLQNLSQSVRLQLENMKMEDDSEEDDNPHNMGKRKMGENDKPAAGKRQKCAPRW